MTAYATVPTAVDALRMGAYDYLAKPFEPVLERALERRRLRQQARDLRRALDGIHRINKFSGHAGGLIEGIVRDAASTQPVANARIAARVDRGVSQILGGFGGTPERLAACSEGLRMKAAGLRIPRSRRDRGRYLYPGPSYLRGV